MYVLPRLATLAGLLVSALVWGQPIDVVVRINDLQPRRDEPEVVRELDELVARGLKERPSDLEFLLVASRHQAWVADGAPDADTRRTRGKSAWDLAERALALQPGSVVAHWYAARGIGAYGSGINLMTAIGEGVSGKLDGHMTVVLDKGPDLELGAPLLARGRYFLRVPWPIRNPQKGREYFERVLKMFPHNLRAHYYLAEMLLRDGQRELAREHLAHVEQGASEYDPPEARRVKTWARTLAQELDAKH